MNIFSSNFFYCFISREAKLSKQHSEPSEAEWAARQSPASPLPPPPASEPVVIIALQTAFIISINLCWLRHGVMRRPARLSTCDSHPRRGRTEGYEKRWREAGERQAEMKRGRELKWERAGVGYTHTHRYHPHTLTHTHMHHAASVWGGSTFKHYILLRGSSLEREEPRWSVWESSSFK